MSGNKCQGIGLALIPKTKMEYILLSGEEFIILRPRLGFQNEIFEIIKI